MNTIWKEYMSAEGIPCPQPPVPQIVGINWTKYPSRDIRKEMMDMVIKRDEQTVGIERYVSHEINRLEENITIQQDAFSSQTEVNFASLQTAVRQPSLLDILTVGLIGLAVIALACVLVLQRNIMKATQKQNRDISNIPSAVSTDISSTVSALRKDIDALTKSVNELKKGDKGDVQPMPETGTHAAPNVPLKDAFCNVINQALQGDIKIGLYGCIDSAMPEKASTHVFLDRKERYSDSYSGYMEEKSNSSSGYFGMREGDSLLVFPNRRSIDNKDFRVDEFFDWIRSDNNTSYEISRVKEPARLTRAENENLWKIQDKGKICGA